MAGKRPLRFWDLALYTVAMTLGVRWIAVAATGGPASLLMWAAAMVGFLLPLNVATSELVGRFPGEGGIYQWTNDTFGSFSGFTTGWVYWTNNLPFFSGALVFIVNALAIATGHEAEAKNVTLFTSVCVLIALLVAGLQLMGLGAGKWLSNIGSVANLVVFAVIIAAGAYTVYTTGPATSFTHANYAPPIDATGALLWSTMVFAFAGAEALAFLKNDVEGGVPKIMRVLLIVGLLLVLGYGLGTAGIMALLSPAETTRLAGVPEALRSAFTRLGYPEWGRPAVLLVALTFLGGYAAWYAVAARLPFVVGVDRYLPKAFATRNPKTGAPTTSLIVQTVIVIALTILSQAGASGMKAAYDFLVQMTVLSYTFPFLFLFAVYIAVQSKPAPEGAWVAPVGRGLRLLLGWVGFLVTLSAILCTLVPSPDEPDKLLALEKILIASAVLILGGVPIWLIAKLRGATRPTTP